MTIIKHKPITKHQNDRQWTRNNASSKKMKQQSHKRDRNDTRKELSKWN